MAILLNLVKKKNDDLATHPEDGQSRGLLKFISRNEYPYNNMNTRGEETICIN